MKAIVKFTFGLHYEDFLPSLEEEFLFCVSLLSGSPIQNLKVLSVEEGCIKFTLEIEVEAFRKLMNAIDPRLSDLERVSPDQLEAINYLWSTLKLQFVEEIETKRSSIGRIKSATPNKIFFIHGWRGGDLSFGSLPAFLQNATGCSTALFCFPSGFFERSCSIGFLSRALDNWVRNELEDSDCNFGLIAHSMGGVVARDFLGSQLVRSSPLSNRVRHVSFIASPLGGTWLADIVKQFPGSAAQQASDLSLKSEYLGHVNSLWNQWYPKQTHLQDHVRSIYTPSDEVVDYASAIGCDPEAIPILGTSHQGIVKPSSPKDEIVRTLARLIRSSGLSSRVDGAD